MECFILSDGYALLEISEEGKYKIKRTEAIPEVKYLDFRLEGCDFEHYGMEDSLIHGIPKELKDVLILCSFKIHSYESFNGESTEYDTDIILDSYIVMKTDYKEFYREMVTNELNLIGGFEAIGNMPDGEESNYYKDLVYEWEEFYDEEFKAWKKSTIKFNLFSNLLEEIN